MGGQEREGSGKPFQSPGMAREAEVPEDVPVEGGKTSGRNIVRQLATLGGRRTHAEGGTKAAEQGGGRGPVIIGRGGVAQHPFRLVLGDGPLVPRRSEISLFPPLCEEFSFLS